MTTLTNLPKRLSVLDDEDDVVQGLERRLERGGFDVERVIPPSPSLEDTVAQVMNVSEAALCDHQLRGGHKVDFSGAELVAALTGHRFPAVLFTGVQSGEVYAIRRNMSQIPAFLRRDEGGLGNVRVLDALSQSVNEVVHGRRSARRRGRRTPVSVISSRVSGSEQLVEVVVAGWSGAESIDIPATLLAEQWHTSPREAVGRTFFASVNINENDPDHLFFEDFEADPVETEKFLGRVTE